MKRHLNSLYVTSQRSYLSKEGETVLVRIGDERVLKIPIHTTWRPSSALAMSCVARFFSGSAASAAFMSLFLPNTGAFSPASKDLFLETSCCAGSSIVRPTTKTRAHRSLATSWSRSSPTAEMWCCEH